MESLKQQLVACQAREAILQEWKNSAIEVTPLLQEIANELGIPLGESIHDKILPGIRLLQESKVALEQRLKFTRDCLQLSNANCTVMIRKLDHLINKQVA